RMDDIRPSAVDPRSRRGSYGYLFQDIADKLPRSLYRELEHYGYVENGNLTREALRILNDRQEQLAS
ncbi:hypothetical protein, partial [Vibrio sp. JPW-9-11-11]